MHTLLTLEDLYGVHVGAIDGEVGLRLDKSKGVTYLSMFDMLSGIRQIPPTHIHALLRPRAKTPSNTLTANQFGIAL
jgi:hypothetical protein